MRSKCKNLLFFISILFLCLSTPIVTHASDDDDPRGLPDVGWEENADDGGTADTTGQKSGVEDGVSAMKTGYLIYATNSAGQLNTKNKRITYVSSYDLMPEDSHTYSYVDQRFIKTQFARVNNPYHISTFRNKIIGNPAVWGFAPFDTNGEVTGEKLGNWLTSEYKDGKTGGVWVLANYLDMSDEEIVEYAQGDNYLTVEPVMWAGIYDSKQYKGFGFCGTSHKWAFITALDFGGGAGASNYLSRYTHKILPNSHVYHKPWLGLSVPTNKTSKHTPEELYGAIGLGIITVRVRPGDKDIIKVYRTSGVVDKTVYGTCDEYVNVKNEGSYKVKKCILRLSSQS